MVTLYTNAPEAYDYGYVVRDEQPTAFLRLSRGDTPVWRVQMPEAHVTYQTGRYLSGLYGTFTYAELLEQEGYNLVRFAD